MEDAHQLKSLIDILRSEIGASAVDVQEAVCGGCVDHGFPDGWVVGVGYVDDGEVDWGFRHWFCCHGGYSGAMILLLLIEWL